MDLKETYNRIAEDWHKDHLADVWWQEGTDSFISLLNPGAHVLDVGCGDGVKSKYLIDHGITVTGIDISESLLEIAKREAPSGEFKVLSMTDIDSLSEKFEGIFAQASLLHIPKNEAGSVVQMMTNKLNPGGFLYIAVKEQNPSKPAEEMVTENDYGYEYERFFSYFTMPELEQYLADAGLAVVTKLRNPNPSGKTVWLQIIGKSQH